MGLFTNALPPWDSDISCLKRGDELGAAMQLAKWIFRVAGAYGVIVMAPLFFLEKTFSDSVHPEFYYGFLGVGFAWQILFFILASDPQRYRTMMIPSILEKLSYAAATFWLFLAGRAESFILLGGAIDGLFMGLFIWAFLRTGGRVEPD
ncbi:MAG: hypothetical protein ACLQJR_03280 [Stellaceae bacterium]